MKILAIDIGNSSIKVGLFHGNLFKKLSIPTYPKPTEASFSRIIGEFIKHENMDGVIVSSVVSTYTELCMPVLKSFSKEPPLFVTHSMNTGLKISVKNPQKLGSDRIVISVAAYQYFREPVAVVDFGTATTINVVGKENRFLGGAILPGIDIMRHCLREKTSVLPLVEFANQVKPLGKDTESCIISGIILGTAGAVERIIDEIENKIGYNLKVVVTGGNVNLIKPYLRRLDRIDPELSLKGLKILYERTKKKS